MILDIYINKLRIYANHGVLSQERKIGSYFMVSLQASVECTENAYLHDCLDGTVNYAELVDCIKKEMEAPSNLLENAAYRMGSALLRLFPRITEIVLLLEKENPPINAQTENVGLKIRMKR